MNVIVANKRKEDLENSNIDAIKTLYGLFNIDDVINNFKNYYYSKMIIDCTSIVDFVKPDILKKISTDIGKEKVIILLPNEVEIPINFYRTLIDLGIYNFTTDVNEIEGLIQNPNTEESITEKIFPTEKKSNEDEYDNGMNGINLNTENTEYNDNQEDNFANNGYDSNNSINDIFGRNNNNEKKGPIFLQNFDNIINNNDNNKKSIIGLKNITLHAGSTTLIYMLKQILEQKYHKSVLAIEIDENDFIYFQNENMISTQSNNIENIIKNSNEDIILIDLNDSNYEAICTDVLYLVEPSIIKINRLMVEDRKIFESLKNKKVILNMCSLSKNDVEIFAHEAEIPIFFVIPYINDRIINNGLSGLIERLNLNNNQSNKRSFFN